MKLETLIGIFIVLIVGLLSVVSMEALTTLGMFAIGWNIPNVSKALATRFRNRNKVEA